MLFGCVDNEKLLGFFVFKIDVVNCVVIWLKFMCFFSLIFLMVVMFCCCVVLFGNLLGLGRFEILIL